MTNIIILMFGNSYCEKKKLLKKLFWKNTLQKTCITNLTQIIVTRNRMIVWITLFCLLKFSERPKIPEINLKKYDKPWRGLATCRSSSCYYGQNRGWYTSYCKEVELEMNLHTSRTLFQKDSSYKSQFCIKVRAFSWLVSEVSAKYKDVPTKMLKRDARTNSS